MRVTSPNHEGGDGTDCEEVWIVTGESAILFIGPPYSGMFTFFPLKEAYFLLSCYLLQPRCAIRGTNGYKSILPAWKIRESNELSTIIDFPLLRLPYAP